MKLFEEKKECCGCWACANICPNNAIAMQRDKEGFEFPIVDDEKCIKCNLCQKVCPLKTAKKLVEIENSNKHIGIINLQFTSNYGAVIAAAALEDAVRLIVGDDYNVQTINYYPEKNFNNKFKQIEDFAIQSGGWKLWLKSKLSSSKIDPDIARTRAQRFNIFKDTFMNLSKSYNAGSDINKDVNYSAFITGSDVVWAPKRVTSFRAEGYFLSFANKGETKIAYAPSLDNSIDKKMMGISNVYKENLKSLDYISVREKSNFDYIQSLTDKNVSLCCDPVMLMDATYFDKMIDIAKIDDRTSKYIYVYILELNQEVVDYANRLATEKGLKICYYSLNHNNYIDNSEDCTADGPAEFLYRLKNAEYVLTNSFHCAVFSLLFHKQFFSFKRSEVSIKTGDLLEMVGLSDRIVNAKDENDIDAPIDFDMVDERIKEARDSSLKYLNEALKDIK